MSREVLTDDEYRNRVLETIGDALERIADVMEAREKRELEAIEDRRAVSVFGNVDRYYSEVVPQ